MRGISGPATIALFNPCRRSRRCAVPFASNWFGTETGFQPFQAGRALEEGTMRKALSALDANQRKALLYFADIGLAMFSAALITACLQLVIEAI